MHRRTFLSWLNRLLLVAAGGLAALPFLRFMAWRPKRTRTVVFAPGEQIEHQYKEGVFLVSRGGELVALSARCTHLCCEVVWDPGLGEFLCPCHGSRYDGQGRRIEGRADRDLASLPVDFLQDGGMRVTVPT